jgi:hypothetical protein
MPRKTVGQALGGAAVLHWHICNSLSSNKHSNKQLI